MTGVFVAKITNLITISYDFLSTNDTDNEFSLQAGKFFKENKGIQMGDSYEHLIWFIQISDLHLSQFHDRTRVQDFRDFCNKTIYAISPAVVIASGDLTDGKGLDGVSTNEFRKEWVQYNDILTEANVMDITLWLDIRGNHDNFNVPSYSKSKSLYSEFSIQGQKHNRSYMYTVARKSDITKYKSAAKYSFIGVDAALDPGPKAPWNFIGKITQDQYELLEKYENESQSSVNTIWFGHYPTSCIISEKSRNIRDLMKNASAYLSGHLHTVYGAVTNMYTVQNSGFLELELADFKDNRMFRVAAFDHGLFSFVDVKHNRWPVILITNPKHALFGLEHKERLELIRTSTHIRILAFSPSQIETVRVKVGNSDWIECRKINSLYVAEWNPKSYSTGVHEISVYAKDEEGNVVEITQPFTLDGSRLPFPILSRISLMVNVASMSFAIYVAATVLAVLPLLLFRELHYLILAEKVSPKKFEKLMNNFLVRRIWLLSTVNVLFYPLVICPLYLLIGPWFIGEMIDGYTGIGFSWGTYVDGSFLPAAFAYAFDGCVQLVWFQVPFTIILSICVESRFRMISLHENVSPLRNNAPLVAFVIFQTGGAYLVYFGLGHTALFLGHLKWWSRIMMAFLWFISARLKPSQFAQAEFMWKINEYPLKCLKDAELERMNPLSGETNFHQM